MDDYLEPAGAGWNVSLEMASWYKANGHYMRVPLSET